MHPETFCSLLSPSWLNRVNTHQTLDFECPVLLSPLLALFLQHLIHCAGKHKMCRIWKHKPWHWRDLEEHGLKEYVWLNPHILRLVWGVLNMAAKAGHWQCDPRPWHIRLTPCLAIKKQKDQSKSLKTVKGIVSHFGKQAQMYNMFKYVYIYRVIRIFVTYKMYCTYNLYLFKCVIYKL